MADYRDGLSGNHYIQQRCQADNPFISFLPKDPFP